MQTESLDERRAELERLDEQARLALEPLLSIDGVAAAKALVALSGAVILVLLVGIVPTRLDFFGVTLQVDDRKVLVHLLGAAVALALLRFLLLAGRDVLRQWLRTAGVGRHGRVAHAAASAAEGADERAAKFQAGRAVAVEVQRLRWPARIANVLWYLGVGIDVAVPIALGVYAIALAWIVEP